LYEPQEYFNGKEPNRSINPDEAVAYGAYLAYLGYYGFWGYTF
jgi:molecular chaperone DnaK (HSP70)